MQMRKTNCEKVINYEKSDHVHVLHNAILCPLAEFIWWRLVLNTPFGWSASQARGKKLSKKAGLKKVTQ